MSAASGWRAALIGREGGREGTYQSTDELEEHERSQQPRNMFPLLVLDAVTGQEEGEEEAGHAQGAGDDA